MQEIKQGGVSGINYCAIRSISFLVEPLEKYKPKTMENKLSKSEQKLFKALRKVKHDSLWNVAINTVVESNDPDKLRELVVQLQFQNKDNPPSMKIILGDAYDAVINYKTVAGTSKATNHIRSAGDGF